MAIVDPFVVPIPQKFLLDPELRPYFEFLENYLIQLRERTGGSEDKVENIEGTQVSEDGGNRSNRFVRDDIDELAAQIADLRKAKRQFTEETYQLRTQIADLKRKLTSSENRVNDLISDLGQVKRASRLSEQEISAIKDKVNQQATRSRLAEQNINELTERYDSGS